MEIRYTIRKDGIITSTDILKDATNEYANHVTSRLFGVINKATNNSISVEERKKIIEDANLDLLEEDVFAFLHTIEDIKDKIEITKDEQELIKIKRTIKVAAIRLPVVECSIPGSHMDDRTKKALYDVTGKNATFFKLETIIRRINFNTDRICKLVEYKKEHINTLGDTEAELVEAQEIQLILPDKLHTDEAVKVFKAAIEAGYITKQGDCYKWNKSNVLLAYMCGRLYCGDSIVKSRMTMDLEYKRGRHGDFPETAICTLFHVKNLGQSRRQMERPPIGYMDIDRLF